jgi:hypothetical protein
VGLQEPVDGWGHVRQQKRIREILEARREKFFNRGRFAQAAVEQTLREQRRDFEGRREPFRKQRLWRDNRPAEFHIGDWINR